MVAERKEWLEPIPGHAGYLVSCDGRVFSTWSLGRFAAPDAAPMREVKTTRMGAGYRAAALGRKFKTGVHRLVALAFHGPPPTAAHQAAHLDGNKTNNHADNIRWKTCVENMQDNVRHGVSTKGERDGMAKLTTLQAFTIKMCIADGQRHGEIARQFGVSQGTIGMIATGKTWVHVPNPPGYENRRAGSRWGGR